MELTCLVDMNVKNFSDEDRKSWIMGMPFGKYVHDYYGDIDINEELVDTLITNFNDNVLQKQPDIDYDHKEFSGEAAGWVEKAERRDDGLWLYVSWTKKAYASVKDNEYKYFSPSYATDWKHPASGKTYSAVLFGGGITNIPFLKGIKPLNMSEHFVPDETVREKMDLEQLLAELAKLLKLEEGATAEQVLEAVKKLAEKEKDEKPEEKPEHKPEVKPEELAMSTSPKVGMLVKALEAQNIELHEMSINNNIKKLSDVAATKGYAISPVAESAIRSLMNTNKTRSFSDSITSTITKIISDGLVSLNESSVGARQDDQVSATVKLNDKINSIMVEKNLSFTAATMLAVDTMPEVFEDYVKGAV